MDVLSEIRKYFAEVKNDRAMKITSLEDNFPAWVLKHDGWYGVGIPLLDPNLLISEKFSNVKLWSQNITIGDKEIPLLLLTSTAESLRLEFSSVCAQFIDPGINGFERERLIANPTEWWGKWKMLLGNSVQEKSVYSILGEMLAFEQLIIEGKTPIWSALTQSTHDIETETGSYEVKSTIVRYGATVTINSQFQLQLQQTAGTELKLIFCRFEQSEIGISVSDVVERLASRGIDKKQLNLGLEKYDLEEGCSARNEKYKLLEIRKYSIDNSFPSITANSFVDSKIPEAIREINYKIDLIGISYENWVL
ncbi:PD-(D/E)XK motif protein [Paenibacillus lignilyticus]|uniref:PD-(D/E)XK motif protein n=1 Tax=Paenibacillus lignilyticus TaxID=1172615 RepID=A0ABS5CKA2_9BACL|nr:PD-(D/E)XK motif protein [Paenibacillus lignilyticus]MBP3966251.1 PD-(D/E)XK motif protein [Paenibacillus lignilyticus]